MAWKLDFTQPIEAKVGQTYCHRKGRHYVVTEFTIDTDNDQIRVTYHAVENPTIAYSRPRSEFEDGRFQLVGE